MNDLGHLFLSGATGHTGRRLVARFLERGWRLRCLSRSGQPGPDLPETDRLEIVRGDLREPEGWIDALNGVGAFLHLAHIGFTPFWADACRRAGVARVIALSSTRRFTRFPDASADRVRLGEATLETSDLDYTILRASMIFGGRDDRNLEQLVQWLRCRSWMPRIAGGRNLVQPIYVWDLVGAIESVLAHPEATRRRVFTVAGPEPMTHREMVETIARAMGRRVHWVPLPWRVAWLSAAFAQAVLPRPPATTAQVRRLLEDKTFNIEPARRALGGWTPRPFPEAIAEKLAGRA